MSDPSPSPTPSRWRRPLFLWTSAAIAVAVMVAAREVMLPFILAVVIAYVLTPLVASLGAFSWAIAPRIGHEFGNLRQELPRMSEQVKDRWIPALTGRLGTLGLAP